MKTGYYYVILKNGYTTIGLYSCMGWTYKENNDSIYEYGSWPILVSFWKNFEGFDKNPL